MAINKDKKQIWNVSANSWQTIFSNFTIGDIFVVDPWSGKSFLAVSGEHAYQALKTDKPDQFNQILSASSPSRAKLLGRRIDLRRGWDSIVAMRAVVLAKCIYHERFIETLLSTGSSPIIEVTAWHDLFWGTNKKGVGANILGQLLMEARREYC